MLFHLSHDRVTLKCNDRNVSTAIIASLSGDEVDGSFSAIERSSSASGMQQILVRNVLADGRMCQQKSGMKQYVDIQ